jgi:hypothetical protein
MKYIILLISATLGFQANAGDNGGGKLNCKSASGRTTLAGDAGAPYNGEGPASLVYTIDGNMVTFDPTKPIAAGIHLVDFVSYSHKKFYGVEFKQSMLSTYQGADFVNNNTVLRLQTIPGSMVEVRQDVFKFKATIPAYSSIDPRKSADLTTDVERFAKDILLNCELDVTL